MRLLTSFASVHWLRTLLVLLAVFLSNSCEPSSRTATFDETPAFWVWHRTSPLNEAETTALQAAKSDRLYWQVVEFGWKESEWKPRPLAQHNALPSAAIPVLRLDPGTAILDRPEAAAKLAQWLRFWSEGQVPARIQIDYDCPVSRLGDYASFLQSLKRESKVPWLSVTALASWIDAPSFPRVAKACEEVVPMFYDLEADHPERVMAGTILPMVHPQCTAWIAKWKTCRTPWRAGLPNFERLTLFAEDGKSLGHLRQWTPEHVLMHPSLQATTPCMPGMAAFRVTADSSLAGTALKQGQLLCWRAPEEETLRRAINAAKEANASGIVWFALPGPGLRTHASPIHLATLGQPAKEPTLRLETSPDGRIALINDGPNDLPCRLDRAAYRLHLTTPEGSKLHDAGPGDFFQMERHSSATFSQKVTLRFPSLPTGARLETNRGWIASSTSTPSLLWTLEQPDSLPIR